MNITVQKSLYMYEYTHKLQEVELLNQRNKSEYILPNCKPPKSFIKLKRPPVTYESSRFPSYPTNWHIMKLHPCQPLSKN